MLIYADLMGISWDKMQDNGDTMGYHGISERSNQPPMSVFPNSTWFFVGSSTTLRFSIFQDG